SLVRAGDPITPELGVRELRNRLLTSPALDDKVGVWTVMETLRLLHGRPLQAAIFSVSTVQEEVGLRGAMTSAYGIHPAVGVAVAAGLIGIPNRYMHSPVEVVSLADLEQAATLLAEFCAAVPAQADWTP